MHILWVGYFLVVRVFIVTENFNSSRTGVSVVQGIEMFLKVQNY